MYNLLSPFIEMEHQYTARNVSITELRYSGLNFTHYSLKQVEGGGGEDLLKRVKRIKSFSTHTLLHFYYLTVHIFNYGHLFRKYSIYPTTLYAAFNNAHKS